MFQGITKAIRDLSERVTESTAVLVEVVGVQVPGAASEELESLRTRLDDLERSRALFEADMEGLLQKVEGERRQARSAEERARGLLAKVDAAGSADESEEGLPPEYVELLRNGDDTGGREIEVPPMRQAVGGGKSAALNRKFGIPK